MHRFDSPADLFSQQTEYFEVMESLSEKLIREGLNKRVFTDLILLIESLLIGFSNGKAGEISAEVLATYSKDIDMDRLKVQLLMVPDLVRSTNPDGISNKKVTNIHTLCKLLNSPSVAKTMFNEVHAILSLYFTIPGTSATVEITFSVLKSENVLEIQYGPRDIEQCNNAIHL